MGRKDQERRRRRHQSPSRRGVGATAPFDVDPPSVQAPSRAPNLRPPWQPGESGNPAGYSRGRRITQALLDLFDEKGADVPLAKVWHERLMDGDRHFWRYMLDRVEGPINRDDDASSSVVDPTDGPKRIVIPDVDERLAPRED